MWLVSPTRLLLLLLLVLSAGADAAVAQMHGNHMRQHSDKSMGSASIDDAVKQLSSDDPEKRLEALLARALRSSLAIEPCHSNRTASVLTGFPLGGERSSTDFAPTLTFFNVTEGGQR
jgi:hypothetical protein